MPTYFIHESSHTCDVQISTKSDKIQCFLITQSRKNDVIISFIIRQYLFFFFLQNTKSFNHSNRDFNILKILVLQLLHIDFNISTFESLYSTNIIREVYIGMVIRPNHCRSEAI